MESRSQKYSKNSRWIWRNRYIPNDVMIQILSRLPGKSLLRFRWACKNWFDLITNPSFAKLQLGNHAINNPLLMIISKPTKTGSLVVSSLNCKKLVEDDDHRDEGLSSSGSLIPTIIGFFKSSVGIILNNIGTPIVVGSCNGLLCIRRQAWDDVMMHVKVTFFIWNPCTNEFKKSSVEPIINSGCYNNIYGFGYDQTIDDYKVISNTTCWIDNQYVTAVQVYTLGTNSWKRIGNHHPFRLCSMSPGINSWKIENYGPFRLNSLLQDFSRSGASFYCLGSKSLGSQLDVIVCFDIAKEEYREISKPWFVGDLKCVDLIDLNGCLGIVQANKSSQSWAMEVWMRKDYCHDNMNKNEYSWTKLYTIRQPDILASRRFKSLGIFNKNGGEILIQPAPKNDLIWYNEKDDSIRETISLKVRGNVEVLVEVYVENLVSLNSGTYMGQKEEVQQAEMVEDNQFYKQRRRRNRNRNRNRNGNTIDLIIH